MQSPEYHISHPVSTRPWLKADLSKPESAIIEQILNSSESLLFIPPRYTNQQLFIPEIPYEGMHIGLFSSGTTGNPRCMWVSREKLILNAVMTANLLGMHPHHKILILASPWHIAGVSWAIMATQLGIQFEILTPYQASVPEFVSKLIFEGYTHLFTTPFLYRHLAKESNWKVDEIVCGGSAFTSDDAHLFPAHAHFVTSAYGQTEAGGIISAFRSEAHLWNNAGCVGVPAEHIRIRCNGAKDQPGPIYIHSPSAVCEGWLDSGDYGYKDDNDNLMITHRKKDIINGSVEK